LPALAASAGRVDTLDDKIQGVDDDLPAHKQDPRAHAG
jgi:hypothetical protein